MNYKLLSLIPIQYFSSLILANSFKNNNYFKSKEPSFYEKSNIDFLKEPLNSFSNFFYFLIPYFLLKKKNKIQYPLLLLTGGSFSLHAIGSSFSADLDRIGMMSVVSWLVELNIKYKNISLFYTISYSLFRILKFINSNYTFIDNSFLKLFTYKEPYTLILSYALAGAFNLHNNNLVKILICLIIRVFDLIYSVSSLRFNDNLNYNRLIFIFLDLFFILSNQNKLNKPSLTKNLLAIILFIIGAYVRTKNIGVFDFHSLWHLLTALTAYLTIP